ncbi:UNVERIFIED_CONTAM: hypothetical protein K2H54_046776 [Gekko kuhli]
MAAGILLLGASGRWPAGRDGTSRPLAACPSTGTQTDPTPTHTVTLHHEPSLLATSKYRKDRLFCMLLCTARDSLGCMQSSASEPRPARGWEPCTMPSSIGSQVRRRSQPMISPSCTNMSNPIKAHHQTCWQQIP